MHTDAQEIRMATAFTIENIGKSACTTPGLVCVRGKANGNMSADALVGFIISFPKICSLAS